MSHLTLYKEINEVLQMTCGGQQRAFSASSLPKNQEEEEEAEAHGLGFKERTTPIPTLR